MKFEGKWLCSETDPIGEAAQWAATQQIDHATCVLLFGFGAGHHVRALRQKTAAPVIVYEPIGELAQHENTRTQLAELTGVTICYDLAEIPPLLTVHLQTGKELVTCSWPPSRRLRADHFSEMMSAVQLTVQRANILAYTIEARARLWVDHFTQNVGQLCDRVPATALTPWAAGMPAFVVSAGPSLSENAEQLKRVKGRARIIAVNTALAALEKAGVRADVVVTLEALNVSPQFAGLVLNRDVPRVQSLLAHPALFDTTATIYPFLERVSFFDELCVRLDMGVPIPVAGSVSHAALSLAVLWGATQITLVGQDLAYTHGRAYSKGTVFEDIGAPVADGKAVLTNLDLKKKITGDYTGADTTRPVEAVELVPAWGGNGHVYSTAPFAFFRHHFSDWAKTLSQTHPYLKLINATEGGAHITGYDELRLSDVVDALPPRSTNASLPQTPRITQQHVREVLLQEANWAADIARVAALAAQLPSEAALAQMRNAALKSGYVLGYCWPPVCELLRDADADHHHLCAQIAVQAAAAAQKLKKCTETLM